MTSENVLYLYNRFKENDITVWIAGGWCVDALVGRQTREHDDLDVAVHRKDNDKLRLLLEKDGYKEEIRNDSSEFMYVLINETGLSVDVHAFEYDESGKIIYGIEFPFGSLTGTGTINGQKVNCIDPEFMLRFITWYEPREKDLHDVSALSEKFGFDIPEAYQTRGKD